MKLVKFQRSPIPVPVEIMNVAVAKGTGVESSGYTCLELAANAQGIRSSARFRRLRRPQISQERENPDPNPDEASRINGGRLISSVPEEYSSITK